MAAEGSVCVCDMIVVTDWERLNPGQRKVELECRKGNAVNIVAEKDTRMLN